MWRSRHRERGVRLHPDGADLEAFPTLRPDKQYRVWSWDCGDDWCECEYVYIVEADTFATQQMDGYITTRGTNSREVWRGTWVSNDRDNRGEILDAERKAAEEHIKRAA